MVKPRLLIGSERRLALALLLFFLALALPAGLLSARAWQQLRWEAFHRYRLEAQDAASRVDAALTRVSVAEDGRSSSAYRYPPAGQPHSALNNFPLASPLPGAIGYFQIEGDGRFSSPLLPADPAVAVEDAAGRRALAARVHAVLAGRDAPVDHALVKNAPAANAPADTAPGRGADGDAVATRVQPSSAPRAAAGNVLNRLLDNVARQQSLDRDYADDATVAEYALDTVREKQARAKAERRPALADTRALRGARKEQVVEYATAPALLAEAEEAGMAPESDVVATPPAAGAAGKPTTGAAQAEPQLIAPAPAVIATAPATASATVTAAAAPVRERRDTPRVRWFESEIEPMKFEQLDGEHYVLFRNVWREGARLVQGVLIDRSAFLAQVRRLAANGAGGPQQLALAWRGRPVDADAGASRLAGELVYRGRLSAPFADLELVYTASELPLGASARYLVWVSASLLVVLALGCAVIYRFGAGQLRLARQQQEFVSAVSHELKTPLTSIRMYSEMLSAGWADEARRQTYYRYIHDESERLSRLIANVLQLARLSRGHEVASAVPVALDALLAPIVDKLRAQCAQAGFELEYVAETTLAETMVLADNDALTQVLINLVDNAIKFAPEGAARRVVLRTAAAGGERVAVAVRDFGKGIAADQMRRIFERFYRGENELTRETVGTGIGLALVAELAAAMDARVDVRNREPGAEFVIELRRTDHG